MISSETKDVGAGTTDYQLFSLANAGVERAYREIRDEVTSVTPTTGVADLRGATTSGTAGANMPFVRYYNEGSLLTMSTSAVGGSTVILQNFDLNYLESTSSGIAGSVIKNMKTS